MKKIYLHVAAMLLSIAAAHGQNTMQDTSSYRSRKLKLEEVNFVSAYYSQDGNHSAVTGGIGTEKLTDFANTFDLQLSRYSRNGRKNNYTFELGIDHYSSASSDKIDPATLSSASSADTRIYPSLDWTRTNEKTGNSFGFTASYSGEYDYQSIGGAFHLSRLSKDKNTQFDWRVQAFLDTWTVILPVELRAGNREHEGSSPRNSFSSSISLSQVISQRLQGELVLEPAYQHGLLATRYQRNYFTDGSVQAETLPSDRYKLPVALRLNYFLADRFILRTFYRYYMDSWGIRAHTAELETPVKLSPFFSVSPFYRYSQQSGARYFAPYGQHQNGERYFTSDYDLSGLNSSFFGAGIRIVPPKGVLGWQRLNALELRYGHYLRSNGLASNIVSLNLKFK
ncbi:DUF3570 domain-containing protein [Pedobacter sp. JY14-1]|uniref:DUF3570 domain-containing protein n=1 Tax=Pedobacter sp. JY14-1 TaxID=3034151 RepID=UPI0023E1BA85|nr:DUF3570 domain-containing protein [Pedobacter sp. JY14-1]